MNIKSRTPKFAPGQVVATPAALHLMTQTHTSALSLLKRHLHGDWGDVCAEDAKANELALTQQTRILSSYEIPFSLRKSNQAAIGRIWIITEADRSVTTFLLPREY
jgi:hypothetical protein